MIAIDVLKRLNHDLALIFHGKLFITEVAQAIAARTDDHAIATAYFLIEALVDNT